MEPERIIALQQIIQHRYNCDASHLASVPVRETFEDQTVWEGTVEVFHVIGLRDANSCYAWYCHHDNAKPVAILGKPPVYSAGSAVRTFMAEKKKR